MSKTTWKDETGREWCCRLTIAEANRLRMEDNLDLLNEQALRQLTDDPLFVVHLLTRLHGPQIAEHGLTEGDFAELCTASESVAIAAADALTAALSDFLRRMRRPALAELVEAAAEAADQAEKQSTELMRAEGRKVVQTAVEKAVGGVRKAIEDAGK